MAKKTSFTILEQRQKAHIKSYTVLCLVMVLVLGFFGYKKWNEYSAIKTVLAKNVEMISELRDEASDEKALYESNKDTFDNLKSEIRDKLGEILPENDDYTGLTRDLDAFEESLATKNNPFEISNIEYQSVEEREFYSVLPLRMSIRSSRENFQKFLHLVETSGSFTEKVRLMEVSSIRLNFENTVEDQGPEIINFTVQINAYFQ